MARKKGIKRKYYFVYNKNNEKCFLSTFTYYGVSHLWYVLLGEFSTGQPPRIKSYGKHRKIVTTYRRKDTVLYSVQELVTAHKVTRLFEQSNESQVGYKRGDKYEIKIQEF